jgi:CRP-like cAMP-binding protein
MDKIDSSATNRIELPPDLLDLGEVEDFPAGTTLFLQGHQPSVLYLIVSGFVKTRRLEGTTEALVSLREPSWLLGLAPAYLERMYSTSGITATPCSLRSISPTSLRTQIEASSTVAAWALGVSLAQGRRDEILRAEMAVRIPVHREHSFRFKVNTDSADAEQRFRAS